MKSEKVQEYLSKCIEVRKLTFCAADIEYAAGLAEQEAEERIREKAIRTYCVDCCCTVIGKCAIKAENCVVLQEFIKKLNKL